MFHTGKTVLVLGAVSWTLFGLCDDAFAQRRRAPRQYRGVTREPYVSPYLNLIRPDADAGLNYIGLVQPQLQQQQYDLQQNRSVQRLGQQLDQQAQRMTPYGPTGGLRPTGHGATFMNYSHYYAELGGPQGGGRTYSSSAGGGGMGGFGGMGMGGMGGGF